MLGTLAAGCARYSKEQEQDMQAVRDAVSADPAKLNASDTFLSHQTVVRVIRVSSPFCARSRENDSTEHEFEALVFDMKFRVLEKLTYRSFHDIVGFPITSGERHVRKASESEGASMSTKKKNTAFNRRDG